MADKKIKNRIKLFKENSAEFDDMTDSEINELFGFDTDIRNKYNEQYVERQKSFVNYLISFDKNNMQEITGFFDDINKDCIDLL